MLSTFKPFLTRYGLIKNIYTPWYTIVDCVNVNFPDLLN